MCVYDYAITMSDENVEIRILDVLKLMYEFVNKVFPLFLNTFRCPYKIVCNVFFPKPEIS